MKIALRLGIAAAVVAGVAAFVVTQYVLTGDLAYAGAELAIGDAVPEFALTDTEGKAHKLSDHKDAVRVLVFCSQECPWSRGADPSIVAMAKEYAAKGVFFYSIDSNKQNTVEAMKEYAAKTGYGHPLLKDPENKYADATGAKVTPDVFVVGKDGKLAYRGAFDDRSGPDQTGATAYVKDAIDALLAGKPVAKPSVKAWGCSIKRVG